MSRYYPESEEDKAGTRTDSLKRTVRYTNGAIATIDLTDYRQWTIKWRNHVAKKDLGSFLSIGRAEEALYRYQAEYGLEVLDYTSRFLSHDDYNGQTIEDNISHADKIQTYLATSKEDLIGTFNLNN